MARETIHKKIPATEIFMAVEKIYRIRGKSGLILVDPLKGFCMPGCGNLAPATYDALIDRAIKEMCSLAREFIARGCPVLVLMDEHDAKRGERPFLAHAMKDSVETELMPELSWLYTEPLVTFIIKDCINGIIGSIDPQTGRIAVLDWLNAHLISELVVEGVCTDICVIQPVLTLLSMRQHYGMAPCLDNIIVGINGVATYDLPVDIALALGKEEVKAHPRDYFESAALCLMERCGAILAESIVF